jgi:hypothetical protein
VKKVRFAILLEHGTLLDCYNAADLCAARRQLNNWRRRQRMRGSPLARAIGLVTFK